VFATAQSATNLRVPPDRRSRWNTEKHNRLQSGFIKLLAAANDRAISPEQEISTAKRMGATTLTLPTSHLPMLAQPQKVADFVIEAAASISVSEIAAD
jgi:pimeloyl-ACP methyl ester carboxylesterase